MKRVAVLVVLVACSGPGAAAPTGPMEVVIPANAPALPSTPEPNAKKRTGLCTVSLATSAVQMSAPTCYLDQHVEDGGVLTYPCNGEDGAVTAVFGGKLEYVGMLRGGEVELEKRTEIDWPGDNCRWGTIGTIRGTLLAGGELTKQSLQWTYADRVVSGTSCSGTCRAAATFDVE